MVLAERIVHWLNAHPGEPQSVAEIVAAIPDTTRANIARSCLLMWMQGVLGRSGKATVAIPHRFYVKREAA